MHVATVVCHYLEPQDRSFQLGSWYTSTRQALKNPDAAHVLNSHLGCDFRAGESGGPRTSYRYSAKHSCSMLALSLLYMSSRERGFSPLIPTQNFGFGMASAIQPTSRFSFVSKKPYTQLTLFQAIILTWKCKHSFYFQQLFIFK